MLNETYEEMLDRQHKETNELPMYWAFSQEQFDEILEKLDCDISELCKCYGGSVCRKSDAKHISETIAKHNRELKERMEDKDFATSAFYYEMWNHEYIINYDGDWEVLGCFGISVEKFNEQPQYIKDAYEDAKRKYMKNAEE